VDSKETLKEASKQRKNLTLSAEDSRAEGSIMVKSRRIPTTRQYAQPNAGCITGYRTLSLTEHKLHSEVHDSPEQAHQTNSKRNCQGKPEAKVDNPAAINTPNSRIEG
jgi:hypothetical protein